MRPALRSVLFAPVVGLCAAVLLTGCGQQGPVVSDYWSTESGSPTPSPTPEVPAAHEALFGDYVGPAPEFAPFHSEGEISFSLSEDNVAFRGNCNNHFGTPEWVGDNLRVRTIGSTQMGCERRETKQDTWLNRFFSRPLILTETEDGIEISDGHSALNLNRTAPDSAAKAIDAGTWNLVAVGTAGEMTDVSELETTLEIGNGELLAGDGCNSGGADVVVTEHTLELSAGRWTMMACVDEPAKTSQQVVQQVLAPGEVEWSIEGDTLRIERGDQVLEYRQS